MRAEFDLITTGISNKLPTITGNGSTIIAVNSGATVLEAITTTGTGSGVRATAPTFTTSINAADVSFTAFAGATTLLTIGGTGASASMFAPSTLDATSSTTGAIRTSGGISAAKALWVGGLANIAGAVTAQTGITIAASGLTVTAGNIGVGGAVDASRGVYVRSTALTGVDQYGVDASALVGSSAATSSINAFRAVPNTAAAAFTTTNLRGFVAAETTKGAGSTITNQVGFDCENLTQGGTLIVGYRGQVTSGAGKFNLYMDGDARNFLGGEQLWFTVSSNPDTSGVNGARMWNDTDHSRLDFGKSASGTRTVQAYYYTGSARGSITYDDTSTAFNTSSDKDLKVDRGVATTPLYLPRLVVHDFDWKETGTRARGVFAQDAYLVHKDAVSVGNDTDLNPDGTKKQPWSVDYSKYVPDLIVGWQNHEARIAALEAKLEARA